MVTNIGPGGHGAQVDPASSQLVARRASCAKPGTTLEWNAIALHACFNEGAYLRKRRTVTLARQPGPL